MFLLGPDSYVAFKDSRQKGVGRTCLLTNIHFPSLLKGKFHFYLGMFVAEHFIFSSAPHNKDLFVPLQPPLQLVMAI